jgi:O-antigen ligase
LGEKDISETMTTAIKNKNLNTVIFTWLCIAFVYSLLFLTYLNSVLTIILVLFWLFFSRKEFDLSSKKTKLMLLFMSLYVIGIAGMIYTNNTNAGFATLKTQSAIFFLPLVFGTTSFLSDSVLKKITTHFLITTTIACLIGIGYGIYNYFQTGNFEELTGDNILVFHVFRPVTMGLFCITAIILSFEKISTATIRGKKILYICLLLMSLMVFLLSIRLILVCWLLIMLYFLFKTIKRSSYKILFAAIAIFALVISGLTIPSAKKQWNELFDFSGSSTIVLDKDSSLGKSWGGKALRIAIWKCSGDVLKKHWLIGVGTGDVQDNLQQAYENRRFYFASQYNKYNAHNEYLQITIANGLPGLLILLSCIIYPLLNYRKKYSGNTYFLFLLLFSVIGISESLLEVNKGIIWYSFFNSIFAFGYLKSEEI